jgi:hypothetical protein
VWISDPARSNGAVTSEDKYHHFFLRPYDQTDKAKLGQVLVHSMGSRYFPRELDISDQSSSMRSLGPLSMKYRLSSGDVCRTPGSCNGGTSAGAFPGR